MDHTPSSSEPTDHVPSVAIGVPLLCYQGAMVEILDLLRDPPGPAAFYGAVLNAIGAHFTIPFAALEVGRMGQVIQHTYRDEEQTSEFWEVPVSDELNDALSAPKPSARMLASHVQLDACLVTVPIVDEDGEAIGAMAMAAPCEDEEDAQEILRSVLALVQLASLGSLGSLESRRPVAKETPAKASGQTLRKLSAFGSPQELAIAITNNLRTKADCDIVALGSVHGSRVRLMSVSGLAEVKESSPAVGAIRSAMEECLDEAAPILHRPGAEGSGHVLHRQWSEHFGGQPVASIPIQAHGRLRAILSMRRPHDSAFDEEELQQIRGLVQPYVEGLDLIDLASRSLTRHTLDNARESVSELLAPRRWGRKVLLAGIVSGVAWFLFGTRSFEVSTRCVVTPSFVQHVSAPFDARILEAPFVAGDRVLKGEVLCALDTAVLELERSRLAAELSVAEIQEREALAKNDQLGVQLVRRSIASRRAQLEAIERQIADATIRAPFDGFVLVGDLHDRIGDVSSEGEPLFQLTETDAWDLELTVEEADILHIREGMTGRFASFARPDDRRAFQITAIHPSVEHHGGRSGVIVEGDAFGTSDWIRPGMEGIARIDAGRRKVWWVALRRGLDAFRVHFWL